MKTYQIAAAAFALVMAVTAPAAHAQSAQPIELSGNVKVDKIVIENGKEKHIFSEPSVVVPGDRLVFTTSYRNAGAVAVKDFVVTNPVPGGVMLAPEGAEVQVVSVDGGKTWGKLAGLSVSDGKGGNRTANAGDVTHLRWTLPEIAPGAKGTLNYNAIVR
jgi:uncharacterized repeat protein (TIGR01451 family)